jgi:hypothetical protein
VINNVSDDLRHATLEFLYCYANEGINEIRMQAESFEEKKVQGAISPMQRLIEKGTKNLRAFDQADLAENIVYLMQYYGKNMEGLMKIFEIISVCGLYRPLANKLVNFGILKDVVSLRINPNLVIRSTSFSKPTITEHILLFWGSTLFGTLLILWVLLL